MKVLPKRPALSIGVVSALAAILILLALLQYRWSGQVSEADRERMQISLQNAVEQFRQDFYRTLLNVCLTFRLGRPRPATDTLILLNERYQDWLSTTTHPELIANVFVWETDAGGGSRLLRLDPATREAQPASWPANLESARRRFAEESRELRQLGGRDVRFAAWTMDEDVPALFRPAIQFSSPSGAAGPPVPRITGYFILELNMAYLQQRLLPELAQRHFAGPKGFIYRVAVLPAGRPDEAIYRSDPTLPEDALHFADARIDLLGPPSSDYLPPPAGAPQGGESEGSAESARPPGFRGSAVILPAADQGRWQLVVKHRSGSLDAVVASMRRRNLAVGFGVLLLLAVSMAMIIVYTQRAQRLAKLQMEFVAGVSHELRTPLAVICSAGDNLADGVVDPDPQVKQYGTLIRSEGRRLTGMVEQILLFAAGQSGRARYDLRPVEISALIDAVLADSESVTEGAGVSVEKHIEPGLPPVQADAAALKQCLGNLISNAIRYGGESRWVGVRAGVAQSAGGPEIRITVEDKGPGIEPAELRHIFEPFYRGRAAAAAQSRGTGLGLSLAQDIAEAMGGKITVTSVPGQGSSFTLSLPAMERPHEPTNTAGGG